MRIAPTSWEAIHTNRHYPLVTIQVKPYVYLSNHDQIYGCPCNCPLIGALLGL